VTDRLPIASYLEGVEREATDRPRAIAAGLLARALRRPPEAEPPAILYVEQEVSHLGTSDAETAAEVVYEIASILAELQERFGDAPLGLLAPGQDIETGQDT
jgi:hypothetical protein